MFKTELHMHSHEVSPCCDLPTEEIAARYLRAGYTTITVTDHYGARLAERIPDVRERVAFFMEGYHAFCRAVDDRAKVLFGFELRLNGERNEYLVYGLGEDFLLENPSIYELSRAEAVALIHAAGGLIYQAHPFRNGMTVADPKGLDGIEIFNAHNTHDSRNYLAYALAKKEGLCGIAGSDFHHPYHWPAAGIMTEDPILSEKELLDILRAGTFRTFGEIIPREQVLAMVGNP